MSLLQGLPAQIDTQCRVLILGSMPGDASLQQARYYAHPRNRFWPLMQGLYGVEANQPYEARLQALNAAGVGLWDVIGQCERQGSLDTAINSRTEVPNPIPALIAAHPQIRVLAFNGGKAAQAFARHFPQGLGAGVKMLSLPSSSPANAAYRFERLLDAWKALTAA